SGVNRGVRVQPAGLRAALAAVMVCWAADESTGTVEPPVVSVTALLLSEIVEASEKRTPPASMSEIEIDAVDAAVPGFPAVEDVPEATTEPTFSAPLASETPAARDAAVAPSPPRSGWAKASGEMEPAGAPAS